MTVSAAAITGNAGVSFNAGPTSYTASIINLGSATANVSSLTQYRLGEYLLLNGTVVFTGTGSGAASVGLNFAGINISVLQTGSIRAELQTTNASWTYLVYGDGTNLLFFPENNTTSVNPLTGSAFGNGTSGLIRTLYFKDVLVRVTDWANGTFQSTGAGGVTSSRVGLGYPETPWTALTVTGTGWTTARAFGRAYSDANGVWKLNFNIAGVVPSATRITYSVTISGVSFPNATQATSFAAGGSSVGQAYANGNASTIAWEHPSATTTAYYMSGDIELASKPTWAV